MAYDNESSLKRYQFPALFMYEGGGDHTENNWRDWQGDPVAGRHNVKKYIPPSTHPKLLNLGGNWIEAKVYEDQGYDCTHVVISTGSHEVLLAEGFKVIFNDMCDMVDVEDGSFDGVISVQALEHVWYPWKALLETWRVLRDGGRVVFNVPQWPVAETKKDIPAKNIIDIQHVSCMQTYQMKFMVRSVGLRLLGHHIPADTVQELYCEKMSLEELENFPGDDPLSMYYNPQHAKMLREYCEI